MLDNDDLFDIKAGAISVKAISIIVAGIVFIIGVIDGYLRPLKCNK